MVRCKSTSRFSSINEDIILTQTDTTVGFVSQNHTKLSEIKSRPTSKPFIKIYAKFHIDSLVKPENDEKGETRHSKLDTTSHSKLDTTRHSKFDTTRHSKFDTTHHSKFDTTRHSKLDTTRHSKLDLESIPRIPKKHKNLVRRAKKTTFVVKNIAFRVTTNLKNSQILRDLEWHYSTSANKAGKNFDREFCESKADIIIENKDGLSELSSSTLIKLNNFKIRKLR